jgi:ribonucleoside-diphosphate reductase alpha chain
VSVTAEALRELVWRSKYRLEENGTTDTDLEATWQRVATALAAAESASGRAAWARRFQRLLAGGAFLPGGRIIAGAGSTRRVTLFNCFVMGTIEDSVDGILGALREGALTMQQGGGVGFDFSTLRPRGHPALETGGEASGPVSFMAIWDTTCRTLLATGRRRGAMMATLRCDHPDIEDFVDAKRAPGALTHFNLSVLVSDAFMRAVAADAAWPLAFPARATGAPQGAVRSVRAKALWQRILRAAYDSAEPGVLFIDRINARNNLGWRERISATNPCGEIPLPPYGACNLGSLNLTQFVRNAFCDDACLDHDGLADAAAVATRMLDDVIDISRFPLPAQAIEARGSRRIGLGITGLADALVMLGLRYGTEASCRAARDAMRTVCHAAYEASVALARERGPFPFLEREPYLRAPFVTALPAPLRDAITRDGIRNSHLTAIAPAGTISLLAGGVSSGIEPVFHARYRRTLREAHGATRELELEDPVLVAWRTRGGSGLPPGFVDAAGVSADEQLAMQAAVQEHVDNAISKTVTVPAATSFEAFRSVYEHAYRLGLKGCTVYRPGTIRGAVMQPPADRPDGPHCCSLERESG